MTIEHLSFIEKTRLREYELEIFFEKSLDCLKMELQRLRNTIYNYNQHEYLFALNERAWVGAFNNAVIRAFPDNATTLQEFGVYNKHSFIGRADFLVNWKTPAGKTLYLLFEAKQYEEVSKSEMLNDSSLYLNTVREQGQKYFEAETDYYLDKTVFIVPLVFGWIRQTGNLSIAKSYFENENKKDKSTDFCYLYYEGEFGAWVYGNVHRAKK